MDQPSQLYPALTPSRLESIGRLIADVRHEAVLLHEDLFGDNNWSLGCRVYARTCFAIVGAALSRWPDWLSVIEETGLHFVFGVGGVPLRFYKGEPDNAPARSLRRNYPEIRAQQAVLFSEFTRPADEILRIAVETDATGDAERISLVQLAVGGETISSWPIDFSHGSMAPSIGFFGSNVAPIAPPKEGVQQAPATVLPFKVVEKKGGDEIG